MALYIKYINPQSVLTWKCQHVHVGGDQLKVGTQKRIASYYSNK